MSKIILLILIFIIMACSSSDVKENNSPKTNITDVADNIIWDFTIKITERGSMKAMVQAGYIKRKNLNIGSHFESEIDSGLVIDFYKNGIKDGVLISQKGRMDDRKGIYQAHEDVLFKSPQGYDLYTQLLIWDRKKRKIFTHEEVMFVSTEKDTIYGDGFSTDENFIDFSIENPRGKKKIDDLNIKD